MRLDRWHATRSQRFWSRVKIGGPDECWEWQGLRQRTKWAYGIAAIKPGYLAHRAAWVIANGPIPEGMDVLHKCDNPPCVNPAHLYLGNDKDNARDREVHGRAHDRRGSRNSRAKLSDANVLLLRSLRAKGLSYKDLAHVFGISRAEAHKIVMGQQWAHLPISVVHSKP